jgi:hypothetical protein
MAVGPEWGSPRLDLARVRLVVSGQMIPQEAAAETAAVIDDFADTARA